MTATPGLLGSYPTKGTARNEDILPREHRPMVLWSVALNTAVTVPVGVCLILVIAIDVHPVLCTSPCQEGTLMARERK